MFRLILLLSAAIFAVMLIAGRDGGQVRYGLIPGKIAPLRPGNLPEPPVVVEAAPVEPVAPRAAEVAAVESDPVEEPESVVTAASFNPDVPAGADIGLTLALPLVEPGADLPEAESQSAALPTAPPEPEPVPEPEVQYVVGTSVNVRTGPSAETEALTKLNRGEAVLVLPSDTPGWSRIRIEGDGVEGYIASRFLSGTPESSLFDTSN